MSVGKVKKRFVIPFFLFSFFVSHLISQGTIPQADTPQASFDFKGHLRDARYFSLDSQNDKPILENRLENRLEFYFFFQEWGEFSVPS